jgi:hypothetical protein
MTSLLRSATVDHAAYQPPTRVEGLIDTLQNQIRLLTSDIELEEQKCAIADIANPEYSLLAKSLRTRRSNLESTVRSLREASLRWS